MVIEETVSSWKKIEYLFASSDDAEIVPLYSTTSNESFLKFGGDCGRLFGPRANTQNTKGHADNSSELAEGKNFDESSLSWWLAR